MGAILERCGLAEDMLASLGELFGLIRCGVVPWIGLLVIMVAIVIAFPATVTALLDAPTNVDPEGEDRDSPDRTATANQFRSAAEVDVNAPQVPRSGP
ncbi:MAG: hypothetical protein HY852_00435 [Bradyrhizobium sp.]|uniref:hypothetical protein n=1 Tax=Bradyrhizobium sp. TaxID=376 RepID=UPI00345B7207|nr:hypothetical protein [Bradyrhizobium sp.]